MSWSPLGPLPWGGTHSETVLISQESKICTSWQNQETYQLSFLLISKWGYFLPDINWIAVGIRQAVLGSELFQADRKIKQGQHCFPQGLQSNSAVPGDR